MDLSRSSVRRARKGIVFSLLAIMLSGLFILLYWSANAPRIDGDSEAVVTRVTAINAFVDSSDRYVVDVTRISTRAILAGITESVEGQDAAQPVDEMEAWIVSCLLDGRRDAGSSLSSCSAEGTNLSLPRRFAELQNLSEQELGITVTYAIHEPIIVEDWLPFQLRVAFNLTTTYDDHLFARWNRTQQYEAFVVVDGLPDPLFARYAPTFLGPGTGRTIERFNVSLARMGSSAVARLLAENASIADPGLAPSYLERLAGKTAGFSSGAFAGYESLIDPSILLDQDPVRLFNRSYTDHQVFRGTLISCSHDGEEGVVGIDVAGIPPEFKLDIAHLAAYNATADMGFTCG